MKILMFISQLERGGAERVISNLANYLSLDNDVTIAVLRKRKIEYEIKDSINIVNLEDENISKKNKIIKNIIRFKNLKKHLMKEKYDIALCFLPSSSFMMLALKRMMKLKVVVSVRNDPKNECKSLIYQFLMRTLYPKADGFVFQTEDAKKYFSEHIQKKSTIILNSLSQNFIIDKPYCGERKKEIISVGRLANQKNQKLLIKAFSEIHKKYPDYKLIIYGEGDLKKSLEKLINKLSLNDVVLLPGAVKNIKDEIYDSKIFVLTSKYEGLPNALMEAMALGIPSISTDCPCGGPKAIIRDGENGFLINVNDKNMLIDRITYLIENEEVYNKISIEANKIKELANPEKINLEWKRYLKKVIED